jgi:hypothetical protein
MPYYLEAHKFQPIIRYYPILKVTVHCIYNAMKMLENYELDLHWLERCNISISATLIINITYQVWSEVTTHRRKDVTEHLTMLETAEMYIPASYQVLW